MLVVEAYRSLEADIATHVEAVGRAAAQPPLGDTCAFGGDLADSAPAAAGAAEDQNGGGAVDEALVAAEALAECAARIAERGTEAGVLHLAMHGSPDGLVSGWRTQVVAIAEPSAHLPVLAAVSNFSCCAAKGLLTVLHMLQAFRLELCIQLQTVERRRRAGPVGR